MPTYEYVCDKCGHAFEKFHSMSAAPIRKCPQCGKNSVRRLIGTGAGLIFKGSGFYITDYRDAAYTEKAKAEAGAGTSDKGTSDSSKPATDAKPAAEPKPAADAKTPAKAEATPAPKAESKPVAEPTKASKSASKSKK